VRKTLDNRAWFLVLPVFALACAALQAAGRPPALALPYLNLIFRKGATPR